MFHEYLLQWIGVISIMIGAKFDLIWLGVIGCLLMLTSLIMIIKRTRFKKPEATDET